MRGLNEKYEYCDNEQEQEERQSRLSRFQAPQSVELFQNGFIHREEEHDNQGRNKKYVIDDEIG